MYVTDNKQWMFQKVELRKVRFEIIMSVESVDITSVDWPMIRFLKTMQYILVCDM